jgi:hypothetical protein
MNKVLYIDKLQQYFKDRDAFDVKDIMEFYAGMEPQISATTNNWRIYSLTQKGVLNRVGRGTFALGNGRIFQPEITPRLKSIYLMLSKEFPFLKMCIWNTSSFNEFMTQQPGRFYILIEVEREAAQSVFFFLKEKKYSVFIEPDRDVIEKYIPDEKETLIVKPLISESPLQLVNGMYTPVLEKMLVDIFCDDLLFSAQQGSEMRTIFQESISKYSVNGNRMFRYAARRGKRNALKKYFNSIGKICTKYVAR